MLLLIFPFRPIIRVSGLEDAEARHLFPRSIYPPFPRAKLISTTTCSWFSAPSRMYSRLFACEMVASADHQQETYQKIPDSLLTCWYSCFARFVSFRQARAATIYSWHPVIRFSYTNSICNTVELAFRGLVTRRLIAQLAPSTSFVPSSWLQLPRASTDRAANCPMKNASLSTIATSKVVLNPIESNEPKPNKPSPVKPDSFRSP